MARRGQEDPVSWNSGAPCTPSGWPSTRAASPACGPRIPASTWASTCSPSTASPRISCGRPWPPRRTRHQLLGRILVNRQLITEAEIRRIVQLKVEESIYDTFLWSVGSFEFHDGAASHQKSMLLSLDVTGIVLEGARRMDDWKRIRRVIRGGDAVLAPVPEAIAETPAPGLRGCRHPGPPGRAYPRGPAGYGDPHARVQGQQAALRPPREGPGAHRARRRQAG